MSTIRYRYTADAVVIDENDRVLLILRKWDPYEGCWGLPGGHQDPEDAQEDPDQPSRVTAQRELAEETGVQVAAESLTLVGTYDAAGRDPRGAYSTDAYVVRVRAGTVAVASDDAARAEWWPLSDLPPLAFDHADILRDAVRAL